MAPVVDMSAFFAKPDQAGKYYPPVLGTQIQNQIATDYLSLVRQQTENRVLNTQALIEYEFLKSRLFSSVTEANKFFELDDQIIVQEYKLCISLSYHKRVFVMEFRQTAAEMGECNHVLELIFRDPVSQFNNEGRSTLSLSRENKLFVWRPLLTNGVGPAGASRALVGLILRWLQNDGSLNLGRSPVYMGI